MPLNTLQNCANGIQCGSAPIAIKDMLFILKRRWQTALAGLVVLATVGLLLRAVLPSPTALAFSADTLLLGVAVFAGVLLSDILLHGLFLLTFGDSYRRRHRELVALFRGQAPPAIVLGAAMAGVGEELVFRGLSVEPAYLIGGAVLFGLLHHVRASLWPFTVWAIYQGLLFAATLSLTQALTVTMTAHFLHDSAGFLLFRHLNRREGTE